jgi:hypothetical protein
MPKTSPRSWRAGIYPSQSQPANWACGWLCTAPNLTAIGPTLPVPPPPGLVRLALGSGRGQGNMAPRARHGIGNGTFRAASLPVVVVVGVVLLFFFPLRRIIRFILNSRPVFVFQVVAAVTCSSTNLGGTTWSLYRTRRAKILRVQYGTSCSDLREESKCVCVQLA